ncbi:MULTISPECIES: diacylglycerol kinase family protein [Sanguibacteroides]|uniref:DeoR faimly transcriptional regulator n=1 Tax=Sanguibacteroides justesenii TaxID=1547597 RepID=A0A0C3R418_9PORP|nr:MULTISPECIES: diacylglycerol kinase family protein [Sanguibacteroides]KIO44065.1 DeoR faimly transcriptional regulator [Sanguibacteroides justesenii]KIO47275.1 DeoR faimly transcriptional regulator [Sanguibacteroides justesenii]PXZ43901.1 diacylglycerol kinase family protein [Sanguibacteroides justesenii]
MNDRKFSIKARIRSFKYAFQGIKILITHEHNARIHLFAAVCVSIAGFLLDISNNEWIAVIFAIGLVFSAEAFNSAIEYLADLVSPDYNELIRKSKDVAAGGVLFTAIVAAIIGLLVFIPRLITLFQ